MRTISLNDLSKLITSPYKINNSRIYPTLNPYPIPFPKPILIEYEIRIYSVDPTKPTNLLNGLGYTYKDNGNWIKKVMFSNDGAMIPVHSKQLIRGLFYIPIGLSDLRFQSQLFLLSSVSGDPLINSKNVATIRVKANGNVILDKSPTGIDSVVWNYGRYDISASVPVNY